MKWNQYGNGFFPEDVYTMHWSFYHNGESEHVCFWSVSIWHAGWIWSSTGGLLKKTRLSDSGEPRILPPNISTGSTSLAPPAPPPQSNRMLYVSHMVYGVNEFNFTGKPFLMESHLDWYWIIINFLGKDQRWWQKRGAHDMTMWALAGAQHLINGTHTVPRLPSRASCRSDRPALTAGCR